MNTTISKASLEATGLSSDRAQHLIDEFKKAQSLGSGDKVWSHLSKKVLNRNDPFETHLSLFQAVYVDWDVDHNGPPPAWSPSQTELSNSNVAGLMKAKSLESYADFHAWASKEREAFWYEMVHEHVPFTFDQQPTQLVKYGDGAHDPTWFPGGKLNAISSCFPKSQADQPAIYFQAEGGKLEVMTYDQLDKLSNRVANSLRVHDFKKGDAIGMDMSMNVEAVAIFLGAIKAGCPIIGIAESFAPDVIATRLRIGKAKGIFTQDLIGRGNKPLPMYQKVIDAKAPKAIVLSLGNELAVDLRNGDMKWSDFLGNDDQFESVSCDPHDASTILFSSGTTGEPKAIPWNHTTPMKCAVDAYLHHNIQPGDVLAWPTSMGWMMGPWLVYAALLNKSAMALYSGLPTTEAFAKFVEEAGVTMLGVVPSLVKAWKQTDATKDADWSKIKVFSSTGECSNFEDMLYLMSTAGYKPVIEYCGGTEIGGGYITSTVVQPNSPATFSTPALGLDLDILDDDGKPAASGELFVVPPSIGLSTTLLNRDHYEVYFKGTPKTASGKMLRRHGDQMERLGAGFFRAHGRADDTMNLGGIKTSSAEIERILNRLPEVHETAAIAVPPKGGGASLLVIYTVLKPAANEDADSLTQLMQTQIKKQLNPLFKIHAVDVIEALPRTASNKVMRRVLRSKFIESMG